MAKGKGRGWHGDSAGHARAAKKGARGSSFIDSQNNSITSKQASLKVRKWARKRIKSGATLTPGSYAWSLKRSMDRKKDNKRIRKVLAKRAKSRR